MSQPSFSTFLHPNQLCTPTKLISPFSRIPIQSPVFVIYASYIDIFTLIHLENIYVFFETKFEYYIFYDLSGISLGSIRVKLLSCHVLFSIWTLSTYCVFICLYELLSWSVLPYDMFLIQGSRINPSNERIRTSMAPFTRINKHLVIFHFPDSTGHPAYPLPYFVTLPLKLPVTFVQIAVELSSHWTVFSITVVSTDWNLSWLF